MFISILLLLSVVNAELTHNEVEVITRFKPYPHRVMKFNIKGKNIKDYSYYLPLNETEMITQLTCQKENKDIKFDVTPNTEKNRVKIQVHFDGEEEAVKFTCEHNLINALENYPKAKGFEDDYKYLATFSICPIGKNIKCKSSIDQTSADFISLTPEPVEKTNTKIVFDKIEKEKEFVFAIYHFSTKKEYVTYSSIKKVININKEDHYVHMEIEDMKNNGAELKSEFFREDFKYGGIFLQEMKMDVEVGASNLDYRDTTGMITTGKSSNNEKSVTFTLPTRYPLLGGWKTSYEVNYNYPIDVSVQKIGELKRFAAPLKVDLNGIVHQGEIDIVLPEGATIQSINYPKKAFIVDESYDQKSFGTYFTKPVVKLTLTDVDMSTLPDTIEIYYRENPIAERTKNIIVACLASSIILVIILYAKIINN